MPDALDQPLEPHNHAPEEVDVSASSAKARKRPKPGERRDVMKTLHAALAIAGDAEAAYWTKDYYNDLLAENKKLFNTFLYNEGPKSALKVEEVKILFAEDAPLLNGFDVLNKFFDELFTTNSKVVAFGEDLGFIGDVNQGFSGLQQKHGKQRIFDTGIRELSIIGQGIGLALRGLQST